MLAAILAASLLAFQNDKHMPPSAAESYKALLKEYAGPPRDFINDRRDRGQAAASKFLAFAKGHPDAPEAVEALGWIASHCLFTPEAGAAMDALAGDYARAPNLGSIIAEIDRMYGDPFEPAERMLRTILKESPHREVRGRAALALAHELIARKKRSESLAAQYALSPKSKDSFHIFKNKDGIYVYVEKPKETDADLARWSDEASALCERVIKECNDMPSLSAEAEATLRTIREIAVGREAPEIEGRDHEGKPFKLSDYRGKVVLLTFGTSWCAPCRALYPRQRELVSRLKDEPFALVSVYPDPDIAYLKKAIDSGEITWRCWCDGGVEGPISERWNVRGYPTIFILDADGVIRHNVAFGDDMEGMIEALIKEAKSRR